LLLFVFKTKDEFRNSLDTDDFKDFEDLERRQTYGIEGDRRDKVDGEVAFEVADSDALAVGHLFALRVDEGRVEGDKDIDDEHQSDAQVECFVGLVVGEIFNY
jgi:hypothetical protein